MATCIENVLQVEGTTDRVIGLMSAVEGANSMLDFARIVPVPPILIKNKGPTPWWVLYLAEAPFEVLITYPMPDEFDEERFQDGAYLRAHLKELHPNWEKVCAPVKNAIDETGYPDWFDFCKTCWGTARNALNAVVTAHIGDVGQSVVTFDFVTLWTPPIQVIKALGKQFPDLVLTLTYADEMREASGRMLIRDGEVVELERFEDRS